MANQACVSLGETVKRNAPASRPLRGKILSTLRKRYEGFGDNYTVADADWGYRPVGNALLAFGREGEAILQAFIDQHGISIPVLSDIDALSFKTLGILNEKYQPGDDQYGIPHPGMIIVVSLTVVQFRYLERKVQY